MQLKAFKIQQLFHQKQNYIIWTLSSTLSRFTNAEYELIAYLYHYVSHVPVQNELKHFKQLTISKDITQN